MLLKSGGVFHIVGAEKWGAWPPASSTPGVWAIALLLVVVPQYILILPSEIRKMKEKVCLPHPLPFPASKSSSYVATRQLIQHIICYLVLTIVVTRQLCILR